MTDDATTSTPAVDPKPSKPALKLGHSECTRCGNQVHYKSPACKLCGQPNIVFQRRAAEAEAAAQSAASVVVEHPKPPPAYVIIAPYTTQLGDVMAHFKKGKVVSDPNLVATLKERNAPIALADEAAGFVCCPNCQHMFAPDKIAKPAKAPKRAG